MTPLIVGHLVVVSLGVALIVLGVFVRIKAERLLYWLEGFSFRYYKARPNSWPNTSVEISRESIYSRSLFSRKNTLRIFKAAPIGWILMGFAWILVYLILILRA